MFGLLFIDFTGFFECAFDVSSEENFPTQKRDVPVGVRWKGFKPLNMWQALLKSFDWVCHESNISMGLFTLTPINRNFFDLRLNLLSIWNSFCFLFIFLSIFKENLEIELKTEKVGKVSNFMNEFRWKIMIRN